MDVNIYIKNFLLILSFQQKKRLGKNVNVELQLEECIIAIPYITGKKTLYTMQTALHDAHNAHDATGDTCDAAMLQCKPTILPDARGMVLFMTSSNSCTRCKII